mmetsp:Transcript_9861/g.37164  ORF Transcript_9861/g.37164 Transcript_9861/m.37164 type:complete len:111 (+) Transcript_9861:504-836(+)
MAVSFEEAVDTLHKMFSSSGYDKQTLAQMLQRQNYHMENTVEEILKLEGQAGNPGEDTSGDLELAKKLAAEMDGYPAVMQPGLCAPPFVASASWSKGLCGSANPGVSLAG